MKLIKQTIATCYSKFLSYLKMHFKVRKNTLTRKHKHAEKRNNHERTEKAKPTSEKLDILFAKLKLHDECIDWNVINENCVYENLTVYMLKEYGGD